MRDEIQNNPESVRDTLLVDVASSGYQAILGAVVAIPLGIPFAFVVAPFLAATGEGIDDVSGLIALAIGVAIACLLGATVAMLRRIRSTQRQYGWQTAVALVVMSAAFGIWIGVSVSDGRWPEAQSALPIALAFPFLACLFVVLVPLVVTSGRERLGRQ